MHYFIGEVLNRRPFEKVLKLAFILYQAMTDYQ